MNIILIVFISMVAVWLVGVGVAAYHVFKYRLPGDASTGAFWTFLGISAVVLLVVIFFVSGANWEAI